MKKFLVTIDGPSGVGKTSVGKSIATILDSSFFSSGSIYRSVAKFLLNNKNIQIEDLNIEIVSEQCNVNGVIFDEENLYENEVSIKSSEIAKKAYKENRPIIEVAAQETDLSNAKLLKLLDPKKLAKGGI